MNEKIKTPFTIERVPPEGSRGTNSPVEGVNDKEEDKIKRYTLNDDTLLIKLQNKWTQWGSYYRYFHP